MRIWYNKENFMKKILLLSLFMCFAFCNFSSAEEIMRGADGTLYRKEGNTIVSSKGVVYQISGDKLFGSDGTVCINRNGILKCRNVNDDDDDKYRRDDRYRRDYRYDDKYRRDDRYYRDRYYRDRYYDRYYDDRDYYRR